MDLSRIKIGFYFIGVKLQNGCLESLKYSFKSSGFAVARDFFLFLQIFVQGKHFLEV